MTRLEEACKRYEEAERTAANAALAVIRARQEEQSKTTFGLMARQGFPQQGFPKKENQ